MSTQVELDPMCRIGIKYIACGGKHTLFATEDSVFACGNNVLGQCGQAEEVKSVSVPTEVVIPHEVDFTVVGVHCTNYTSFVVIGIVSQFF